MSRRRRESTDTAPQQDTMPEQKPGEGPQIEVKMRGNAEDVKAQLGVAAAPIEEKPPMSRAAIAVEDLERFMQNLRNPTYIVKVKRLRPKEWNGQKANVEVWTSELPLGWEEIREEVTKTSGGGTYKASVIDPQTGSMVDANNFEVEGDPILESSEMSEVEKQMFGIAPKDATQTSIDSLDRRAQVTAKLLEVEGLEHQLEEARQNRGGGKKNQPQDDGRINDLERRLNEARHQAELEARDRKHQEEMKELRALITQNQKPAQQGPSELTILIQQMQKAQESSDKRFSDLMKQMQDDKMNQLLQKIDNLEKRPATKDKSDMVEMAESMLTLKKVFGWGGGDDDDEEEDEDDDRPWWQKALDKLGDKLTPRVIDKIFAKLDGLESSGKQVTKDDFMKINQEEIEAHARRVADEEISRRQIQIQQQTQAALPPPAPAPTPAAPSAAAELPPAAPQAVQPPPQPSAATSVAQKLCQMAAGAIMMIEQELELMPNNVEWYWNLWDGLAASMLERVCTAPDPVTMFDAFRVEGMNVAELDKLKARISADLKAVAWLKVGHDELRMWWVEKQKNPSFDPAADQEEVE